jgi:chromosome segregation ATPase
MSDEHGETVDLGYIGRALRRLTDEVAMMRDQMTVQTAILQRHERTLDRHEEFLIGMLQAMREVRQEVAAMVAQNTRIVDRLRALDERVDALEDKPRP